MSEQDKERIEKGAQGKYPDKGDLYGVKRLSYIEGATSEHERTAELLKQERNKAIDDVIEKLCTSVEFGCIDRRWEYVKQDLESLKLKSE